MRKLIIAAAALAASIVPISPATASAVLSVEPTSLNFGSVEWGGAKTLRVTVSNPGDSELVVTTVGTPYSSPSWLGQVFSIAAETCTASPVPAGGTCHADVTFDSPCCYEETATGGFTIQTTVGDQTVALQGTPAAEVAPIPFHDRDAGRTTLRYLKDRRVFRGAVTAEYSTCEAGKPVLIKKKKTGPDVVVGRRTTDSGGRFKLAYPKRRGTYYAIVARSADGATYSVPGGKVTCGPYPASDTVRIR